MHTELLAAGIAADVLEPNPSRDAIDGVVPSQVVAPHTGEAAAALLAEASRRRMSVVIRGAGTKLSWGRRPRQVDAILDTRRLNGILAHEPGDLTATVEAGVPLQALNDALAAHGQWLPLDPPFGDRATIGGLLASSDSGPHRHRFGTPRDLVIGVRVATTEGRLAKAGGQVVKNVAGYDLSRLVCGSFGALAAIVSATFKLSPLPAASATLIARAADATALTALVAAIADSQLEPLTVELHAIREPSGAGSPGSCLIRFGSLPAVVEAQVAEARGRIAAFASDVQIVAGGEERASWQAHGSRLWAQQGAIVRVSWLPAALPAALDLLARLGADGAVEMIGRARAGAGLMRIDGDIPRQLAALRALRESQLFGNVVLVRADAGLKAAADVWGPQPNAALFAAIKQAMDPVDTLGAGRGPL